MLLFNEKNEMVDIKQLKEDLKNLDDIALPTEQELEEELSSYYYHALNQDVASYNFDMAAITGTDFKAASFAFIGGGILNRIRKFVCKIITGSSSVDDIITAVLDVISSIIPGGIILKKIVQKIVKYILSIGVDKFCKIA